MIFFSLSVALWIVLPKTANIIYLRLGLYEIIRRSPLVRWGGLVDIPNILLSQKNILLPYA